MIRRPWGTYEVLLDEPECKVKRIFVYPKQRFSLQYHNYREEHWTIVDGIGTITQGDISSTIRPVSYTHLTLPTIYSV